MSQTLATLIAIPLAVLATWGLGNSTPWRLGDMPEIIAIVAAFTILWKGLVSSIRSGPHPEFAPIVKKAGWAILGFILFGVIKDLGRRISEGSLGEWI